MALQAEGQPLFYKSPSPLLLDKHKEAGLSASTNYRFAKASNSVPINVTEFAEVAKYYPIAFTGDDQAIPVALVGLKEKHNLFINKLGDWRKGVYVPAYVRRYPFAFTPLDEKNDNFALCVDESSERFSNVAKKKDMKFFNGAEQTEFTKNAMAFCVQFHKDFTLSRQFSEALIEHKLLADKQVNVNLDKGKTITLGGFKIIDEARFMQLDAKIISEWHKSGLLALVYFHFLSMTNWPKLADLLAKDNTA